LKIRTTYRNTNKYIFGSNYFHKLKIFIDTCDFGVDPGLSTCDWKNRNGSVLKWELGAGTLSNWLGGPPTDSGQGEDAERGWEIYND